MLLLLLLDLGAPIITNASVLKNKNKYMTNGENNTLTKTTKEQQGFRAPNIVDVSSCYTMEIPGIS